MFLGETEEKINGHDAVLLECNIDDMNPEFFEYISERLFIAGASDVYIVNIIMKKGRPGNVLNVICEEGSEEKLKEIIFTESTSVGYQKLSIQKRYPFQKIRYDKESIWKCNNKALILPKQDGILQT